MTTLISDKTKNSICEYQTYRKDDYNVISWYQNKQRITKRIAKRAPIPSYLDYSHKIHLATFIISNSLVFKIKNYTFQLPPSFNNIKEAIEESSFILDLSDNWDDENALKVPDNVWLNAIRFLIQYSIEIDKNYNSIIKPPSIMPCSDGSIDLFWNVNNFRMLINFRNSEQNEAYYYADKFCDNTQFKGSFLIDSYQEHIESWLKNMKY